MGTKKTVYYEDTDFGPMRTDETVEYTSDDDYDFLIKTMRRKLKWVKSRGSKYFDKNNEDFSVHGAWSKGYHEGILSVLQDLLDED